MHAFDWMAGACPRGSVPTATTSPGTVRDASCSTCSPRTVDRGYAAASCGEPELNDEDGSWCMHPAAQYLPCGGLLSWLRYGGWPWPVAASGGTWTLPPGVAVDCQRMDSTNTEIWLRPCGGEAMSIPQVSSTAIVHPRTHLCSSSVSRGMRSSLAAG
jgi:hypothetical protein